jgi:hypothetical protein
MIFSNRQNAGSSLIGAAENALESLKYLDQRIKTLSEIKKNSKLATATDCINLMRNEIERVTVSGPTQIFHCG